jgi:hypothetical protein
MQMKRNDLEKTLSKANDHSYPSKEPKEDTQKKPGGDREMEWESSRRFGKLEEAQWEKHINQRVIELLEDKILIFRKENMKFESSEGLRPFVNSINVKIQAKEINSVVKKRKKEEYLEQRFRITKSTTFTDLKEEACCFWGLDPLKYSLYDENLHDLMSLN